MIDTRKAGAAVWEWRTQLAQIDGDTTGADRIIPEHAKTEQSDAEGNSQVTPRESGAPVMEMTSGSLENPVEHDRKRPDS